MALRDFHLSIRTGLSIGAVAVVLLAAGIVYAPFLLTSRASIADLNARLNTQVIGNVGFRVNALLDNAVSVRSALGLNLAQGVIDPNDKKARDALFLSYLLSQPGLTSIELARQDNSATNVRRGTDGTIRVEDTVPGDPSPRRVLDIYRADERGALTPDQHRTGESDYRPTEQFWYLTAFDQDQPVWSNIYRLPTTGQLGVTTPQIAADRDGNLLGAIGVTISLNQLSGFLDSVEPSPNGAVFLTNVYNELVALQRGMSPAAADTDAPMKIAKLEESDAPAVRRAVAALRENRIDLFSFERAVQLQTSDPATGETWFVTLAPLAQMGLVVAVVIPESDVFGAVNRNSRLLLMALAAFVPAIMLLAWLASRALIGAPLARLTANLRQLEEFRFDQIGEISSRFTELRQVSAATRRMATSLASFRKYVPTELVRSLFALGVEAAPGGERRELTILFMDLAGFTALSEQLGDRIIPLLSDYLSEMSECIQAQGGTIDKYIGDAVMAFWGAPSPNPRHALDACTAALACQARLAQMRGARGGEWAALHARIGINTGSVLVGNVGSRDRLNYTVIGDAVNVASRLEALNKLYGSAIIIGEGTQRAVADAIVARPLDRVAVYGKAQGVETYELLGLASDAAPGGEWLALYEQGRAALHRRDWDGAIALFERAAALRGGDRPAELQIERARRFKTAAPAADWDGLVVLDEK